MEKKKANLIGNILGAVFITLMVGGILYGTYAWTVFKYHDCLNVGHAETYCLVKIFSN